jgi:hypothetical protein
MAVAISPQRSHAECSSSDFRSQPRLEWAAEQGAAEQPPPVQAAAEQGVGLRPVRGKAVMLHLVQPIGPGGKAIDERGLARANEARREISSPTGRRSAPQYVSQVGPTRLAEQVRSFASPRRSSDECDPTWCDGST